MKLNGGKADGEHLKKREIMKLSSLEARHEAYYTNIVQILYKYSWAMFRAHLRFEIINLKQNQSAA